MLRIGELSKYSRVSTRMLRYYDNENILKPSFTDEDSGYRFYDIDKLEEVQNIVELRDMGFGIEEIKSIIKKEKSIEELLIKRKIETMDKINEENYKLYLINKKIEESTKVFSNIEIEELKDIRIISYRGSFDKAEKQEGAWDKLIGFIHENNVASLGALTLFQDKEFTDRSIDIEVCCVVNREYQSTENIKYKTLKGEKVVSLTLCGDYESNTEKGFKKLFEYIAKENLMPVGIPRQEYIVGDFNEKDSSKHISKIMIPIR